MHNVDRNGMYMKKIVFNSCYIEITSKCNLKCLHCYNDSNTNLHFLDFDILRKTFKSLKDLGVSVISISGGEPLLHPSFKKIIEYNDELGITTDITTNGTMLHILNDDIIKKINKIQISLDGSTKETQDTIRGQNCYELIINNIKGLIKKDPDISKKLSLKMVINKLNKDEIKSYIDLAKKLSITDIRFSFMLLTGRALHNEELSLSIEEKLEIMQLVNDISKDNEKLLISQLGTTDVCPYTKDDNEIVFNTRIDYKGDVYPCQSISHEKYCFGNINTQELESILSYDKIVAFLDEMKERQKHIKNCQKCVWSCQCKGGCVGTSFFKGKIFETDQDCLLRKRIYNNAIKSKIREKV